MKLSKVFFLSLSILALGIWFIAAPGCNTAGPVDETNNPTNDGGGHIEQTAQEKQVPDTVVQDKAVTPDTTTQDSHESKDDHEHGSDHSAKCVTLGGYCVKAGTACKAGSTGGSAMGCHDDSGAEGECCLPDTVNRCEAKGGHCVKAATGCATGEVKDSAECPAGTSEACCLSPAKTNCVLKGGYCASGSDTCKDGYYAGNKMGCPGEHDDGSKCCRRK